MQFLVQMCLGQTTYKTGATTTPHFRPNLKTDWDNSP